MANEFDVMDMIDDYAAESGIDAKDIFKKPEPKTESKKEEKAEPGEWRPDAKLTEGMDEFQASGAVYDKDDVVFERQIVNGADEELQDNTRENMNDLERKEANIEEAKKRHGITKLQIPAGELQVRFLLAAGSHDHAEAQDLLDQLLDEVEKTYPEMILERVDGSKAATTVKGDEPVPEEPNVTKIEIDDHPNTIEGVDDPVEDGDDVKVVIDKSQASDIVWSEDEIAKIKKSRTLELNIVEAADLNFGSIDDIPDNAVDAVLETYQRKTNDIAAPLPASHYRATFSGLTYPEVVDLSSANSINTLDGEKMKWTIVFNHMRNVSIGPWEEYDLYTDPDTHKQVKVGIDDDIPANVPDENIHRVTKFEDFLRKTSYIDLEYCLWKILCATAMDKEVIAIDCHSDIGDGKICGNSYDWIYSPNELLSIEECDPTVLENMEKTTQATTVADALEHYKTSPVCSTNYVELHSSGFKAIYGHISAYEYLNEMYTKMKELSDEADKSNPEAISKALIYELMVAVKAILIPNGRGGYTRIKGFDNVVKVLSRLDEIDYETLSQIKNMMITPYQFKFSIRGIVCPKCKNRSSIPINDMTTLLFIVARSLSNVNITLKRQ